MHTPQSTEILKVMVVMYGSLIVLLLSIIAFTLRRFISQYDSFKEKTAEQLTDHETRITVLEKK